MSRLDRLKGEQNPFRREGVAIVIQHLMDRPLNSLVPLDASLDLLVEAMSPTNVQRFVDEHVIPGFDRHRERAVDSGETIGDALPLEARRRIEAALVDLDLMPPSWALESVDMTLMRELFAPVLQATLLSFARRLPLAGTPLASGLGAATEIAGGIASRIRRSVGERAEKIADAGRRAAQGISEQLDKRLQQASRELSGQVADEFKSALAERLRSERGRELVAQIRRNAFRHALDISFAELMDEMDRLPRQDLEAVIGETVAHNLRRRFGQAAIREEVGCWLASEGARSVASVLALYGIEASLPKLLLDETDGFVRGLVENPAFQEWFDRMAD